MARKRLYVWTFDLFELLNFSMVDHIYAILNGESYKDIYFWKWNLYKHLATHILLR